ncbi:hypothetical protein I6A84_08325 [Frankia sp. CNm7]|uniref:hypothetical protein n=1 Tax=Frankia nepalensis TaxID=1836974 RepID=UPI0019336F8D|nr:hypothetical protein [Frankia nepalensis]MBL7518124.1 hypothetical protein [Frankia nepalensis]
MQPTPRADKPPTPPWNLTALDRPTIIRLPDEPGPGTDDDPTRALAAAALHAQTRGDPAAPALIRQLAEAGVVAVRAGRRLLACRETVNTWVLLPTHRRATARALAHTATTRAHDLAVLRRRTLPPEPPGPDDPEPEPEPARPHTPGRRSRAPRGHPRAPGRSNTTPLGPARPAASSPNPMTRISRSRR